MIRLRVTGRAIVSPVENIHQKLFIIVVLVLGGGVLLYCDSSAQIKNAFCFFFQKKLSMFMGLVWC